MQRLNDDLLLPWLAFVVVPLGRCDDLLLRWLIGGVGLPVVVMVFVLKHAM